jgi:hypothetical protein
MLIVAQVLNQLFNVDGLFVRVEMLLAVESAVIDEEVGISNHSRHCGHDVVVHLVELATFPCGDEQLGDFLLLGSKDNAYAQTLIFG